MRSRTTLPATLSSASMPAMACVIAFSCRRWEMITTYAAQYATEPFRIDASIAVPVSANRRAMLDSTQTRSIAPMRWQEALGHAA
ncbi:hypothetical protein, partial [Pseudomonas sp. MWU12-2115]|uniref:hypothetical protein n=1 Tax=Pseudomonas sp. MWU12-2115 TaxID=2071713 RepID=UPI001C4982E3